MPPLFEGSRETSCCTRPFLQDGCPRLLRSRLLASSPMCCELDSSITNYFCPSPSYPERLNMSTEAFFFSRLRLRKEALSPRVTYQKQKNSPQLLASVVFGLLVRQIHFFPSCVPFRHWVGSALAFSFHSVSSCTSTLPGSWLALPDSLHSDPEIKFCVGGGGNMPTTALAVVCQRR